MDNFNKVISFMLGLVVVIVLLVILTGRFNLREKFLPLKQTTPTPKITATTKGGQKGAIPTPTRTGSSQPVTPTVFNYDYHSYKDQTSIGTSNTMTKGGLAVKTIPTTGAPTLLIPIALSALAGGIFLRRHK